MIDPARRGHWSLTGSGIFFVDLDAVLATVPKPLNFYSFETRKVTQLGAIEKIQRTGDASFSVSHDGRWIAWRQTDRFESNLMLIDNFR